MPEYETVGQDGGKKGVNMMKEKKDALYEKAVGYGLKGTGISRLNKKDLVERIRAKQQEIGQKISRGKGRGGK